MILRALQIRRKVIMEAFMEAMKKGKFGITYSTNLIRLIPEFLDHVMIQAAVLKNSPEFQNSSFNVRVNPPYPLLPTPSSRLELGIWGGGNAPREDIGWPRNFPARAKTLSNSSFNRAFSIQRCCSSKDMSPIIAGPPQLVHIGFLIASLIVMFPARSLSFSCLNKEFSWRSN